MVAETPQQVPAPAGAIVPVGQARSSTSLPTPDLEGVKQIITQTRAIGIILPPPDIRAIIDKTSQFVAKNGLEFEKRILASEANNSKFNFLNPTDPYHAYYRMRVKNFQEPEEGKEAEKDTVTPAAAAAAAVAAVPAPVVPAPPPVTTRPLEKPEDEKYTVHVPEGLTALDLDLIKLTAQFVARNGAAFLTGLTQREANNPQFYFLKPTHSMFGFFTSLADAYSAVLMPDKGLKEKLAQDATDRSVILERCLKRLEWDKARAREAQELEDEQERERVAMQQIDWHDFVVVETIDFYEDEDEELPPPMSLKDLVRFMKEQTLGGPAEEEGAEGGPEAMATDQAGVPMDEQERALLAAAAGAQGAPPVPEEAEQPAAVARLTAAPEPPDEDMEDDMDMEDDEGPIKVVKNYKRTTQNMAITAGGVSYDPTKFAVSPITGELIAHADMAEHMRISLLDPRWKEQKDAMLSKIKDTTKADDEEITRNLLGLARTRPDIFGSTEEELAEVVTAAVKEKQTSGQGRAVAWDGQTTGGEYLRNQRQAIQENRKEFSSSAPSGMELLPPLPQAGPAAGAPAARTPAAAQQQQRLPPPPVLPPPARPPMAAPPPQQQQQQQQQQQRMSMGGPPLPPPPMAMRPPPPPAGMMRPPVPMPGPPPMGAMAMPPLPPGPGAGMPLPPPPGPAAAAGSVRPAEEDAAAAGAAVAKRPRLDFVLTPEEDFLAQIGDGTSKVRVQCPEVAGSDKLIGQMLEVEVATLRDTVGDLKARLEGVTGLPVNKQKLNREGVGFLRDEFSLAHYNVSPDVVLVLGTKERGGRKK